jgi:GNAT superfamily N-acetyltransferase
VSARVVRLTESDWRLFAVVRLRALADSLGEDNAQYQREVAFTAAQWRRRLRDHAQFAAWIDNRPVGLVGAQQETAECVYLYSLWLDPEVRGQGLARPLVAAAVDWARGRRARVVALRVSADNAQARGVYENLGFTALVVDDGGTKNRTEPPGPRDEVTMTLSVN